MSGMSWWRRNQEVVEKVVKLSTVDKGKQKAAPTRVKVYSEVDGPVSGLLRSMSIYH
jgi:hypothetical protein